ncbi:helix-turn-helix transcriptional regulator [bacterium]|nr:helix-turn-helix transcriptional regulator [bacterium]MBP9811607.1 helix-turn-helix transcriptional regulator [bacterium]
MIRRSDCPIACTLDLLGDKWTLLVLRDIVILKKSRFEQFFESPEKIATNILTDRLHKLEKAELITKAPYSSHRYRMAYTATEKGMSTAPILKEFARWGLANIESTSTAQAHLSND